MIKFISLLIFVIILAGLCFRKKPPTHIPLMLTAFAGDLALLAYIELTRHAVAQVLGGTGWLMKVHVSASVLMLVGYCLAIATGRKLLRKQERWRVAHRTNAAIFVACRLTNLVTSFFVA